MNGCEKMRVGIFDSGLGGLVVLKEILKKYPNNEFLYYGDTLNVPYGNKSIEELLEITTKIINYFNEQRVDLIIIACGTVSSNCYFELCKITSIPILDIISSTIRYLNNSSYNKIGVIGTLRTIESGVFTKKLPNKKVSQVASVDLASIIENNTILENMETINNYLNLLDKDIECLVLGCTHYPILLPILKNKLSIPFIDMGKCLVKVLKLKSDSKPSINLYFSKLDDKVIENINQIIPFDKQITELIL